LNNVSFEVAPGELLVILGPNGVGKTTLLKCLYAALRPEEGAIMVEDRDISKMTRRMIAYRLSYVPQRCETGRLTVFDAVLLGRKPHIKWMATHEDIKKADAVIKTLGLEGLSLRFLDELSGGELQKVSIARALVQEPKVLLLDEPTSSLDLKNQQEILKTIRHIVSGHGTSAVMTLHDINSALRFADKILFMKDGKIFSAIERSKVSARVIEEVYGLPVMVEKVKGHPVVVPA
jgi:iron complex transport system ATP-binding protein